MESRICVFKVSVISADKVWTANAGKDSGKAAVSVRFPGQDAADIYQSDAVMPSPPEQCTADEASTDEPQQATQNNPDSKKNKDKSERIPQSSSNCGGDSSTPLSFCFQAFSDYVRASDWLLCHQIVTEPLAISLLWISPSSQTSTIVGTVSIDLSELLFSNELFFEKVCVIEADETKKALPTKKDGQKATSKGKKGNALDEVPPHLSPGATMKINVTLDTPILSENDRDESVLLDFRDFCVLKVPPQNSALNASAATYSLAFEIPGFVGPWWSELTFSGKEMKESIGVARFDNGLVSNISSPQQSSMTSSLTANHNMEEETANSDDSGTCGRLTSLDSISWNASFRRFLPSVAVRQLKEDIMRKKTWHGEIANYSTTDQSVSSFDRDHLCFDLDLAALLNEGICETRICSALKLYIADQPLLRDKNTVNKILKNDSGHESTDQNSPWETYSSELAFCIKLNRSLQPAWVSPPKPQLTLEDVLPMRPKPPSNIDKLKIAVKEFQDLVQEGAQSIFLLQEKIASESMSKLENPVSEWRYRVEHKDELRQSISSELLRSGTWHHLKEEMKQRIVKIACEMLRFRKESQENNFEFYNSLYVQLLEVIHKSLKDLDSMRMEGFLSYSGGLESGASGRVYTRDQLRQLADNYEADEDYLSANKCYEEILSEERTDPDLWVQYGFFLMRGSHKDHGKAEECFREAINLQANHALSLLALASLMWHRSFYQQSEVLLNVIIDLNLQGKVIAWVLLGQVLTAIENHSKDASNCFTQAEKLFGELKDVTNLASHELKTNLLNHPFSLSHSMLQDHYHDDPYIDTALLLLDLHLPTEAQAVLKNEHAASPCNTEYKLCQGRTHELLNDFSEAERWMKEATGIDYLQGAVYTLLGHLYFKSSHYEKAIGAYAKMLRYGQEQPSFVLGSLELGKSYLNCHRFQDAKQTFLDICSANPNSSSWLGAGIAFFEEADMARAEAAFVEGNVLDPWNFKLWTYLAMTCAKTDRMEAAEFACDQALQLYPCQPLLVQMAQCFYEKGNTRLAERALLKACDRAGQDVDIDLLRSCGTWNEILALIPGNKDKTHESNTTEEDHEKHAMSTTEEPHTESTTTEVDRSTHLETSYIPVET